MKLFWGTKGQALASWVGRRVPATLALSAAMILTLVSFWGLLSLSRPSPELDPRVVMARLGKLAQVVLSVERDCQDYLVSGSVAALEAYRDGNRGVEELLSQLAVSEEKFSPWVDRVRLPRLDLAQALTRWREDYSQRAVAYRLSGRLSSLDAFLRKNVRAPLSGRVRESLDRLSLAYSETFDARGAGRRRQEALFILGLVAGPMTILIAGFFLSGGNWRSWWGQRQGSWRRPETLIPAFERIQGAQSEESLSQVLAEILAPDSSERESSVLLLNEDGVTVRISGRKDLSEKGPVWAPLLDDKSVCPVFASGTCRKVEDVNAPGSPACPCPVGAPEEGGYLCVPLRDQGRIIGLANIRHGPRANLDKADAELVSLIASMGLASLRGAKIMNQLSLTDSLTGVFNRKFMEASLRHQVQTSLRLGRPMSVLLTDLDHFTKFNEIQSRGQGDIQLKSVAATIQDSVRGGDLVARFGGDEFIVILPNTHFLDAKDMAEKIRGKAFQTGMSLSIGLSCLPEDATAENELLLAADQALCVAKRQGRNRVICFQEMWPGISSSSAGGARAASS